MVNDTKPQSTAIYRMRNNTYLGDCICVVYVANERQMQENGLTDSDISIYIKTRESIDDINSIKDLKKSKILQSDSDTLLRIASECEFGTFGDSHCDCESQRIACLNAIKEYRQGVYIHMPQEGQGRGLFYKAQELEIQVNGTTPSGEDVGPKNIYEASSILSGHSDVDKRKFSVVGDILDELGLIDYKYTLITSNPSKADELSSITGIDIVGNKVVNKEISIDNAGEYLAKIYKKDFALSDEDLHEIYTVLFNSKEIPNRTLSLLKYIGDDLALGKTFNVNYVLLQKISSLYETGSSHSINNILNLDRSDHYREYQVELQVDENNIEELFDKEVLQSLVSLYFEENYFYDLVYLKNITTRDLKIRRKSRINNKHDIIESRLIYKISIDDNTYDIKNIAISNEEISELLTASLQEYEAFYVPVFTHTCETQKELEDLTILIKRYSMNLRTLSIMGDKKKVSKLLRDIGKVISLNKIPDPTNIRTIDKNISLDFDYDKLSEEEISLFKKYYKG